MATASDLIVNHGDAEGFAAAINARVGTVRVWKSRNSIPRTAWPEIQRAIPNVTLESLLETERARDAVALTEVAQVTEHVSPYSSAER